MAEQLKKLVYDKKFIDSDDGGAIAKWKVSPWKVFFIMIAVSISLIILYGFLFTSDSESFFGQIVFYGIVLIAAIAIIWLSTNTLLKFRKIISGFIIAFILILVFYWALNTVFGTYNLLDFHQGGYTLWLLITILAGMGAKRIDGNLDKNDVGYGLLVFIVLIGANIPINNGQGFLWNMDNLISTITGFVPIVGLL